MAKLLLHLVLVSLVRWAQAAPFAGEADLVASLPGLGTKLANRHFSGYLTSSLNGSTAHLHYWFFESQTAHPEHDPVVLWLNGGPGCSSMMGAVSEIGPLHLSRNGSLSTNPFAWNAKANLLFLESPVGVGFSYMDGPLPTHQTDATTAQLNLDALKSFYEKFPHLANNSFIIAGESYAGIYIPTLSVLALNNKFPAKFEGVAMGNPVLDTTLNGNSMLHFYYNHGLLDTSMWDHLVSVCCTGVQHGDLRHCDFVNNKDVHCVTSRTTVSQMVARAAINHYNIYGECQHEASQVTTTTHAPTRPPEEEESTFTPTSVSYDQIAHQLILDSLNLSPEEYYASGPPAHSPPCLNQDYLSHFFNEPEVKKALHIDAKAWDWGPCRGNLGYQKDYPHSMKSEVKQMVESGLKVLVYNGDVDAVCNFLGDQWFMEDLGYKTRIEYHHWNFENQVAGFAKFYDKQLTFMTIRGAGHMVPEDKPAQAFKMFSDFLGIH